jgi:putative sterol carrier protein
MTSSEFIHSLPARVNPDAIANMQTVFHFDVEGEGGGQYTVVLNDGKMEVSPGLIGDSKCLVKTNNDNFMAVINGTLNPLMAIMMGKLKINNQGEMLKYAKIFGLMK